MIKSCRSQLKRATPRAPLFPVDLIKTFREVDHPAQPRLEPSEQSHITRTITRATLHRPTTPKADTGTLKSSNGTTGPQLIVSEIADHSAQDLCDHPRSRGPDFVSKAENLFCDMSARKTYPLCGGRIERDCFAFDHEGKRIRKRGGDGMGNGDTVHRDYHATKTWGV